MGLVRFEVENDLMATEIHFGCTRCGQCCRDAKIPLTVDEAFQWLQHEVQLLCEASPWTAALDVETRALHFKRRSFAAVSGSMPTRVVVMLAANAVGACPNLLSDNSCGINENRPLVCRIYPAEINPSVPLNPASKACPPEAWTKGAPLQQRDELMVDERIRKHIDASRAADAFDAALKSQFCRALNVVDTALVHVAVLVYSPTAEALLAALACAAATVPVNDVAKQWRFSSTEPQSLSALTEHAAIAALPIDHQTMPVQLMGCKREAIFRAWPAVQAG